MNKEIKEKWIAALRSGEYEQAKGSLYDGTGYCCLGVLCRIAGESVGAPNRRMYPKEEFALSVGLVDEQGTLPQRGPRGIGCLANLNDEGFSFEKIADIIEEQL